MLTYFDVVEHLITSSFGGPQDAEQRDIRTAAHRAYGEVSQIRDWEYYQTHGRIAFADTWEGTVTFDKATNVLTKVTGDAFPTDAKYYTVRVGDVVATVQSRQSNTALLLNPVVTFAEDILTATPASAYRSTYPLPSDFRNLDSPLDESAWDGLRYVRPDVAMKMERAQDASGPFSFWTVIRDPHGTGWAIKVLGYPQAVSTLDFTYRRTPRAILLSGHESRARAGTITASGTAITGSSTSFAASMVGSYLRVGTSSDSPGGPTSLQPYTYETKITAYSSATSITVDSAVTASGAKYVITDPIDMSPTMEAAMLSCAEYWLARLRGVAPEKAMALYQRDLRLAFESDQLAPYSGNDRIVWDTYGWRTPLQPDNFDAGGA
jgi:hypothetical protein